MLKMLLVTQTIIALSATIWAGAVSHDQTGYPETLRTDPTGACGIYEDETRIGIHNNRQIIVFEKKTGSLLGIWNGRKELLAGGQPPIQPAQLWYAKLLKGGVETTVSPSTLKRVTCQASVNTGGAALRIQSEGALEDGSTVIATAEVSLKNHADGSAWNFSLQIKGGESSIWEVQYPCLSIPPLNGEVENNRLATPYRQGALTSDPFLHKMNNDIIARTANYPSAGCIMQFLALYNERTGTGLYLATEDPQWNTKKFTFDAYPKKRLISYSVTHFPAGRGQTVREYAIPYALAVQPFDGDWYDSARIYRSWLLREEPFKKGPVCKRGDIPAWFKESAVIIQLKGSVLSQLVKDKGAKPVCERFEKEMGHFKEQFNQPFLMAFYNWRSDWDARKSASTIQDCLSYGGHSGVPVCEPLFQSVKKLKGQGMHSIAYINSMIYDQGYNTVELPEAEKWVVRDRSGKPDIYNEKTEATFCMCRTTAWWQHRYCDIACEVMRSMGADGIYMDSFGKGAEECFATNHGHPVGGGNTVVSGQRTMAHELRESIRRINPEAIMGGEGSTENYADVLDFNLYSENHYQQYIPLRRAVYGDYMMCHGRNLDKCANRAHFMADLSSLFLEGAILGRFVVQDGSVSLMNYPEMLNKTIEIADYTAAGREYLRFGELLKPPHSSVTETVQYLPESKKVAVTIPAVAAMVYRSHLDGTAAVVFVNRGDIPVSFAHDFPAQLRHPELCRKMPGATLMLMNRSGDRKEVRSFEGSVGVTVELAAGGIGFYIIK